MDNKTFTQQTGQARGKLMRLERDLGQAERSLGKATRNRLIGGVIALLGLLALIGFLMKGGGFVAFLAVAGLGIGGFVFIQALMKMRAMRRSIHTTTDGVTDAQSNLTELEAQSPTTE